MSEYHLNLNSKEAAKVMGDALEELAFKMFTAEAVAIYNVLLFLSVLGVPREETRVVISTRDGGRKAIQVTTRVTGDARFCAPWDQPGWVTVHQQKWVHTGDYTFQLRQEWNPC